MIRYILAAAVLAAVVLVFCLSGFAQGQDKVNSPEAEKPKDLASTHDAIRTMRDGLLKAIEDKDVDSLLNHLHEDVVLTAQAGTELKVTRKHAGVREYMDRLLTSSNPGVKTLKLNIEVDDLTILHGEDTGIAYGSSNDHYILQDGSEFDLATRWSATLVKDGRSWKVANLQLSTNLFDNPVLDAVKTMLYVVGIVAVVIGLLIGFVIAKIMRPKKVESISNND